jgi:hypothetical protein
MWLEVGAGSARDGGISHDLDRSETPSLDLAPDGTCYVAWANRNERQYEIYVRRWDGFAWQEVGAGSASGGGISNTSGDSKWLSMAVAPDGTPWVAWEDWTADGPAIYVRHWDGSAWQEAGPGSASDDGISNGGYSRGPSVAVAPDGVPYVAWSENTSFGWEVYVLRWDGSSWQEVGAGSASGIGISNSGGSAAGPSVAIAPDGTVYVAWENFADRSQVHIRRWIDSTWQEVGLGSASGGGISQSSGDAAEPVLAIAPNGRPYVAWYDNQSGDSEIYVRSWTGSVWQEVGQGSAGGRGISGNSGHSETPSIAVNADGVPYVAWSDYESGISNIFVRTWDGSAWLEAGAGGASDGGISKNSGDSWRPSLSISPTGIPFVAWYDDSLDDFEIYVLRYMP